MGTIHGKNGTVKSGANTVSEIQNFSVTTAATTADDTAMGDDWETHLVGIKNWQGSLECSLDLADTNGQETLVEGASIDLSLYPEGASATKKYWSGTATITEVTRTVNRSNVVTRSFNFKGNGALSLETVGA